MQWCQSSFDNQSQARKTYSSAMREKNFVVRHFNARALKSALFSGLCRFPGARAFLNYYQDAESFEVAAEPGSVRSRVVRPARDYGVSFRDDELRDLLRCRREDAEGLAVTFKMARIRDVTVLGAAGVMLSNRSGKVLHLDGASPRMHRNWVVARPLAPTQGAADATYINLLGVRQGHRHFAHFFWDTMVPFMVYLKEWHDPAERIVCLVREDLSAIQRDTFRFIEEDWPGIRFQPLSGRCKIVCPNAVYLAYQNRNHGVDNVMARDDLRVLADLYVKHYGVAVEGGAGARRIYVSRQSAQLRRPKNEAALSDMLKGLGFEAHDPGRLPFREQVALFSSAGVIVAPHGAALANLMFCRPGARVLEFFPRNYSNPCYAMMCRAMGLEYRYLFGGRGNAPKLGFVMDPDKLRAAVEEMTAAAAAGRR